MFVKLISITKTVHATHDHPMVNAASLDGLKSEKVIMWYMTINTPTSLKISMVLRALSSKGCTYPFMISIAI